jgi:hypothetical protein
MGTKVFANGRGIATEDSGGQSAVFPDVCKTPSPGGPVPLPYPNVGRSADTSKGPKRVKVNGKMPMVKGAQYTRTSGDEAGTAGGGIVSGSTRGPAEFMNYSFDVKYEGRNVCRLGDPLFHNKKNAVG